MQSLQLHPLRLWDQEYYSTLFHGIRFFVRTWTGGLFTVVSRQTSLWPRSTLTSTSGQMPRWGARLPIATASDRWSQEEAQWSINVKEPLMRSTALSSHGSQLHSSDLLGQLNSFGLPLQSGGCSFSSSLLLAWRILH